jgi:hypothetical protein
MVAAPVVRTAREDPPFACSLPPTSSGSSYRGHSARSSGQCPRFRLLVSARAHTWCAGPLQNGASCASAGCSLRADGVGQRRCGQQADPGRQPQQCRPVPDEGRRDVGVPGQQGESGTEPMKHPGIRVQPSPSKDASPTGLSADYSRVHQR